jgi:GDP-D-mannose dehydratase
MKVALVTGITGQDGSYLAELLERDIWSGCKTRAS